MTTLRAKIYPIPIRAGVLLLLGVVLLIAPSAAVAQCEGVAGAGDQYCETLPGVGGERRAIPKPTGKATPGVAPSTGRQLERSGAGSVARTESPARGAETSPGDSSPAPAADGPRETGLPFILAALTAVLVLAAIVRRFRRGPDPAQDAVT